MDIYQQNILEHYKNPRHNGKLVGVPQAEAANPSCGDKISFQSRVKNNKIVDLAWQGEGCVLSQATASILAEDSIGRTIDYVSKIDDKTLLSILQIEVGPNRLRCATLALEALKKAIE